MPRPLHSLQRTRSPYIYPALFVFCAWRFPWFSHRLTVWTRSFARTPLSHMVLPSAYSLDAFLCPHPTQFEFDGLDCHTSDKVQEARKIAY